MNDCTQNTVNELVLEPSGLVAGRPPISLFAVIFIVPFIIGAIAVSPLVGYNYLVVALGAVSAAGYLVSSIRFGFTIPRELLLFILYVAWSFLGIFNVVVPELFYSRVTTMFQFAVMITLIAHFSANVRNARMLLWAVLVGAAIVAVSAYATGEYQRADTSPGETGRTAGLALNSNAFAMTLVYAMAILLYFFKTWKSRFLKTGTVIIVLVFAKLIIASGSRKGFICYFLLLLLWFAFSYRSEIVQHPARFLAAGFVVVALAAFLYFSATGTLLERRIESATAGESGSVNARVAMIKEGIGMIAAHPLVGVGLDHFRYHSRFQLYSHCNYVEVTTSSGIPGGILYYSIFLVIWLRLRRLGRNDLDPQDAGLVNMAKAFVVVNLVADLALVSYYSKMNWIIMAIIIGWSYYLERRINTSLDYQHEYAQESESPAGAYDAYDDSTNYETCYR